MAHKCDMNSEFPLASPRSLPCGRNILTGLWLESVVEAGDLPWESERHTSFLDPQSSSSIRLCLSLSEGGGMCLFLGQ
jgi:hypothetical protein